MSTTTNLKLFKHDNPTTNTNQFDIEKAINENLDKLDANAGEVANKIQELENTTNEKDTELETEIKVLKEENAMFRSQIPSATVVGETVHLEDSSNMPCQIMPLGVSKQETREGYNLADLEKVSTNGVSTAVVDNNVITTIIPINTANSYIFIPLGTLENNKTYTLTRIFNIKSGTSVINMGTVELYKGKVWEKVILSKNQNKGTFTPQETAEYRIRLANTKDEATTDELVIEWSNIMVYEGTEEKPYEQYGASPSIEYEAPIESVGDNINLWKMPESQTKNGVTLKVYNDGTYDLFGKATANTEFIVIGDLLDFKKGDYYTFSTNHTGVRYQLALYNGNTWVATPINRTAEETTLEKTINPSTSAEYTVVRLLMTISSGATLNISKGYLKLEKGNKKSAYSPYGQGSIEIYNCNENLFNKNDITQNGFLSQSTGGISSSTSSSISNYIRVKELEDYIVSGYGTDNYYKCICFYDKDKTFISAITVTNSNNTYGGIVPEKAKYLRFHFPNSKIDAIKLEKGATATEYVEHQSQTKALYTQQPLRAIGEVKDRFVKQNGVWYEEHNIERMILNGTEGWQYEVSNNRYYFAKTGQNQSKHSLSSHFIRGNTTTTNGTHELWTTAILFRNESIASLADWKNWLVELYNAGTPVYVDYVLATPELIECTPEQVEQLESFNTYKNITNISSDSIGELEVTYLKDLETLLNNINQAVLGGN